MTALERKHEIASDGEGLREFLQRHPDDREIGRRATNLRADRIEDELIAAAVGVVDEAFRYADKTGRRGGSVRRYSLPGRYGGGWRDSSARIRLFNIWTVFASAWIVAWSSRMARASFIVNASLLNISQTFRPDRLMPPWERRELLNQPRQRPRLAGPGVLEPQLL